MNADRPALNAVLLVALALLTVILVLVEEPRVPIVGRLRRRDQGPGPPGTYLISHVVLLI